MAFRGKKKSQFARVTQGVHPSILKQARRSGQLNLTSRGLSTVPDAVWFLHQEIPGETQDVSFDQNPGEAWWDQVDLTKLILASNFIVAIPDDIRNFPYLSVLDEICKQYGNSYSATIDSAEVNDRLRPMLRKLEENLMNKFWIGLYYEQGDWRWFKTREPANYTNWEQGEPQVWDRCAMYAKSLGTFVWRGSYQCSWKPFYNFICEKELYHFYQ